MQKLDTKGLRNLKYGDKVYRVINGMSRGLRFVAIMPSCKNYLIFEDGEYLTSLYIHSNDGSFTGDWYTGKYDSKFIGQLKIEYLQRKIESIKMVYFKN